MNEQNNYRVIVLVENFQTNSKILQFDDFKIESIKPGSEAANWRKRLHCKKVPRHILIKDYLNYTMAENDFSGFDCITEEIFNLLLTFRLFKCGDLYFTDILIENIDNSDGAFSLFRMDNFSIQKYILNKEDLQLFIEHKNKILKSLSKSDFLKYPIEQFLRGSNKEFNYKKESISRIVDYVVALESIFLIDSYHWFLRRTLANRIADFFIDIDIKQIVKFMYDTRSNIVHGNNIELDESKEKKLIEKLKKYMIPFEELIRNVFIKLFDLQFKTSIELKEYIESLYKLPDEVIEIMNTAKTKSEKILDSI